MLSDFSQTAWRAVLHVPVGFVQEKSGKNPLPRYRTHQEQTYFLPHYPRCDPLTTSTISTWCTCAHTLALAVLWISNRQLSAQPGTEPGSMPGTLCSDRIQTGLQKNHHKSSSCYRNAFCFFHLTIRIWFIGPFPGCFHRRVPVWLQKTALTLKCEGE